MDFYILIVFCLLLLIEVLKLICSVKAFIHERVRNRRDAEALKAGVIRDLSK